MCNLNELIRLITAAIGALVAVIAAAAIAVASPWPFNLISVGAGVAAAFAALFLMQRIETAFNEYRACRDSEEGPSTCSTSTIQATINTAKVIASGILTAMVGALAAGAIPVVGNLVGIVPLKVGWILAMGLIALLTALLAFVLAYRSCRDAAQVAPVDVGPPGTVVGPLRPPGNITRPS